MSLVEIKGPLAPGRQVRTSKRKAEYRPGRPPAAITLLQERDAVRRQRRLDLYSETRHRLRAALTEIVPGHRVILFGSLTRPGVFNDRSDVDLALESEPSEMSVLRLIASLSERLDRPVDVVLLRQCRFSAKILREGEVWTA